MSLLGLGSFGLSVGFGDLVLVDDLWGAVGEALWRAGFDFGWFGLDAAGGLGGLAFRGIGII